MSKNLQIAFLGDNHYPASVEPRMVELLSKFYGVGYKRFYIKAENKCLLTALKDLKQTNHDLEINVYVKGFLADAPTDVNLVYVTHESDYFEPPLIILYNKQGTKSAEMDYRYGALKAAVIIDLSRTFTD